MSYSRLQSETLSLNSSNGSFAVCFNIFSILKHNCSLMFSLMFSILVNYYIRLFINLKVILYMANIPWLSFSNDRYVLLLTPHSSIKVVIVNLRVSRRAHIGQFYFLWTLNTISIEEVESSLPVVIDGISIHNRISENCLPDAVQYYTKK